MLVRMAEKTDISLRALLAELCSCRIDGSYYAVWHSVRCSGLTSKKTLHASEQDRRTSHAGVCCGDAIRIALMQAAWIIDG